MDGADGALTVWAVMMCEGEMTQDSKHVPERSVPPLTPRVRKSAPSVCHGGGWGGLGGDKGYARMNGRRITTSDSRGHAPRVPHASARVRGGGPPSHLSPFEVPLGTALGTPATPQTPHEIPWLFSYHAPLP